MRRLDAYLAQSCSKSPDSLGALLGEVRGGVHLSL